MRREKEGEGERESALERGSGLNRKICMRWLIEMGRG